MTDCKNYSSSDYPDLYYGMEVELYNGGKGKINNIELGKYFYFYNDSTRYHVMDIKYIF